MQAPYPSDEDERLAAVRGLLLLDTPAEPAFDRITRLVARTLDVPIVLISLIDADRQWFKSRIGIDTLEISRQDSICAHAILQSSPLVVEDARLDGRFADNIYVTGSPQIRFYAGVPLRSQDGHALGTLCAMDVQPRQLDDDQLGFLSDLAEVVAKEFQMREALRQARTQLIHTDAELVASEARFRSMFELASVGIALVAPDGGWISINDALCRILGYSADELARLPFRDITYPDDLDADLHLLEQLVAGQIDHYHLEKRYLRKDGRPVWAHLSVTKKMSADGELEYFISIVRDIQARKEAEEALAVLRRDLESRVAERTAELLDANRQLRAAIEEQVRVTRTLHEREVELSAIIKSANEAYVGMDESGIVTAWNPQAERLFGWPPAEAVGRYLDELIVPDSLRDAFRQEIQRYRDCGSSAVVNRRIESPAICRDGSALIVEASICAVDVQGRRLFGAFLHDISDRKQAEERSTREARLDPLTGLLNRRALVELLPLACATADANGATFAVVFLDLDGFKDVNDTWGHDAGDVLLRTIAERLKGSVRRADTVVRLAGDEFVVVLEGLDNDEDEARTIAEKLRTAIRHEVPLNEGKAVVFVDASVGVAVCRPGSGLTSETLMRQADAAMYEAKHAGKGRVHIAGAAPPRAAPDGDVMPAGR